MPWYRTGTVAITAGQNTVTGTGTNFSANGRVGDAFLGPDGRWYEVTNIASGTVLSILPAYQGATVSGGTYAITPVQGYTKTLADKFNDIANTWGSTLAGLGSVSTENVVPVNKGGTGGNTAALGRSGLGLKSAAVADIVGTVSQSGGVPTGAIIERGSNANGDYVRFADGTQICFATVSATAAVVNAAGALYASDPIQKLWPIGFVGSAPAVSFSAGRGATDANILQLVLRSISIADIYYRWTNTFSSGSIGALGYITAIGRWY